MKQFTRMIAGVGVLWCSMTAISVSQTWQSTIGQQSLQTDSNWVLVKREADRSASDDAAWLVANIDRIVAADENIYMEEFLACSLETSAGYEGFLDSLEDADGIYMVEPFYRQRVVPEPLQKLRFDSFYFLLRH